MEEIYLHGRSSFYSGPVGGPSGVPNGFIYVFFDHLPSGISPYRTDQWKGIFDIMDLSPNYEVRVHMIWVIWDITGPSTDVCLGRAR